MKPGYRAGQTYRARTYGHASRKHLLTKTRRLFNTSFSLVLYRERHVWHTHTGMAAARKSPFRIPYERTDGAEEAVQWRRKGSSTSRKRLFGGAEEPLWQGRKMLVESCYGLMRWATAACVKCARVAYLRADERRRQKTSVF